MGFLADDADECVGPRVAQWPGVKGFEVFLFLRNLDDDSIIHKAWH